VVNTLAYHYPDLLSTEMVQSFCYLARLLIVVKAFPNFRMQKEGNF